MPKRVDANQPGIVKALRQVGASVTCTHEVGQGYPDLSVGYRGHNYLLEVKVPQAGHMLTPDERKWFSEWKGDAVVVTSPEDALRAIHAID